MAKDMFEDLGFVEFEDLGFVEDTEDEIQTDLQGIDISQLPTGEEVTPLMQEEQRFQEQIIPMQEAAKMERELEARERTRSREAGKLTIGEKIEDVLITRDVTESPESKSILDEAAGIMSLPARALGALFQMGDIEQEETKLLKPVMDALDEWAGDPEDRGMMKNAASITANILLEMGSDPTALVTSGAKNAFRVAMKKSGKTLSKKQADDFVKEVQKSVDEAAQAKIDVAAKRTKAGDVEAEEFLVAEGGPEAAVQRLKDEGIDLTTEGIREIPQEKVTGVIEKLKDTPIEEFDITDAIERTVVPIDKNDFVREALRGNVTKQTNLERLVSDIVAAGDNPAEVKKLLRDSGFDNPNKVAGVFNSVTESITGGEARDLISELNRATKGKNVTANQRAMNKVRKAIEDRLKKSVGDTVPDDALEDYIALREIGTGKFATKKGKLGNILKRKGDKTLDEKASADALNKMIIDAEAEISKGRPGKAFQNLEEIDEIAGTNISSITKDKALADRFKLSTEGDVLATPATIEAAPKKSLFEGGAIAGQKGIVVTAARNITTDIINKANRKNVVKLIRTISKQRGKQKLSTERLKQITKDIEAGKQFLKSEIEGRRSLEVIDAMVAAGLVTARELYRLLGDDAQSFADQAIESDNNRVRALGKKIQSETMR